jgi:hypothetical protein
MMKSGTIITVRIITEGITDTRIIHMLLIIIRKDMVDIQKTSHVGEGQQVNVVQIHNVNGQGIIVDREMQMRWDLKIGKMRKKKKYFG